MVDLSGLRLHRVWVSQAGEQLPREQLPELPPQHPPVAASIRRRQRFVLLAAITTVAAGWAALWANSQEAVWFLPADYVAEPASSSITVLVREMGCSSGQGAAGRMLPAAVHVTPTEVVIGVQTRKRYGAQNCQNHPLAPLKVNLGQPLGDRVLVDAHGTIDDAYCPPRDCLGGVQVPAASPR